MTNLIDVSSFDSLLEKASKLQNILHENPDVVTFLQLLKETRVEQMVMPAKVDKLIGTKQAAEILGVAENRIGEYVRDGLLTPLYTPPVSHRKFWLSEVMAIPKRENYGQEVKQSRKAQATS